MPSRRLLVLSLAAAMAAVPGTAVAKGGGGGGGGGSTPAPPTVPPVLCDYSLDGLTADGGSVFSNQVGDAGCLSVIAQGSTLRVYNIALTPGWTDVILSNGEGTNSRVAVDFTNAATGQRAEARIEFGKTVIR